MKKLITFCLLNLFISGANAQSDCAGDLQYYQNQKELIQEKRERGIDDVKEALSLINSNRRSKAKPILLDGIRSLEEVISDSNIIARDVFERSGSCRRERGFLLIVWNQINKLKDESEIDLDLAEKLRNKYY